MLVEREIGEGPEYIYAYHFSSQTKENKQWPCKIGRARQDPESRIKQQQASMQEEPVIGVLIKTDNCRRDELLLHTVLRNARLPSFGKEWFMTNPESIVGAYYHSDEELTLGMRIRLARYEQGLSQTQLADATGLRQATISKAENDFPATQLGTYLRIMNALHLRLTVKPIK